MINQFLLSLVLAAHVLGLTLPQVFAEGVYVVPTLLAGEQHPEVTQLEWRVLPAVSDSASRQNVQVSSVLSHFLPLNENRFSPPIKIGTSSNPSTSAGSALLMDRDTGMVLWQKNPDTVRPIASITKLMTAVVYLKHQPPEGMEHVHTLAPEDNATVGYNLTFPSGTQLTTGSLFSAMLVGSLNNAALALNGATGLSREDFLKEMNRLAAEFGMRHSTFIDPTGVQNGDVSTVGDIALLAKNAFSLSEIEQFASVAELEIKNVSGDIVRTVHSTDQLVDNSDVHLTGAKTGTTQEAGFCFVFQAEIEGHQVIGVILGDTSDANRFTDAQTMIQWTSEQFDWYTKAN